MTDLELLDAELVGFDPMDLVKALPGVLKDTGQALDKKAKPAAPPPPPPPKEDGLGLPWKIGIGAAAGGLLLVLLRRW